MGSNIIGEGNLRSQVGQAASCLTLCLNCRSGAGRPTKLSVSVHL